MDRRRSDPSSQQGGNRGRGFSSLHRRSDPGTREPVALAGWPGKKERHPLAAKTAMRLLQAILKDALDLAQIEVVVRDEPALTYKPLRYLNSPIMEQIEKGIRQRLLRPCRFWLPVRGLTE